MVKTIFLTTVKLVTWFKVLTLCKRIQRESRNVIINAVVWNSLITDNQLWGTMTQEALTSKLRLNQKYSKNFNFSSSSTSPTLVIIASPFPCNPSLLDKSKMKCWWWEMYPSYFLSQLLQRFRKSHIISILLSEQPSLTQLQGLRARGRMAMWSPKKLQNRKGMEKLASDLKIRLQYDKNDNLCIVISAPVPINYVSWWPGIKVPGSNQQSQLKPVNRLSASVAGMPLLVPSPTEMWKALTIFIYCELHADCFKKLTTMYRATERLFF